MKIFDAYAKYYDLLYSEKDYGAESKFVESLLEEHECSGRRILELGCGTGKHAFELGKNGWQVLGIDLSQEMVMAANSKKRSVPELQSLKCTFEVGDARKYRSSIKFDAVISLFHVLSYQTTTRDVIDQIKTAATHLEKGGLFVFDFWYGPAVMSDPPVNRLKQISDSQCKVTRFAESRMDPSRNKVTVNYKILVQNKETNQYYELEETHPMRYFFNPELEYLLETNGLAPLKIGAWMSSSAASPSSWYAYCVAKKN